MLANIAHQLLTATRLTQERIVNSRYSMFGQMPVFVRLPFISQIAFPLLTEPNKGNTRKRLMTNHQDYTAHFRSLVTQPHVGRILNAALALSFKVATRLGADKATPRALALGHQRPLQSLLPVLCHSGAQEREASPGEVQAPPRSSATVLLREVLVAELLCLRPCIK